MQLGVDKNGKADVARSNNRLFWLTNEEAAENHSKYKHTSLKSRRVIERKRSRRKNRYLSEITMREYLENINLKLTVNRISLSTSGVDKSKLVGSPHPTQFTAKPQDIYCLNISLAFSYIL